jgi:hypothetical protein
MLVWKKLVRPFFICPENFLDSGKKIFTSPQPPPPPARQQFLELCTLKMDHPPITFLMVRP